MHRVYSLFMLLVVVLRVVCEIDVDVEFVVEPLGPVGPVPAVSPEPCVARAEPSGVDVVVAPASNLFPLLP